MRYPTAKLGFFAYFTLLISSTCAASGAFSFRIYSPPKSLDWQLETPTPHRYLIGNLMQGLFRVDSKGALVPVHADSYEVDASGLRYTIKLKLKAAWSDGVPVRAKDYLLAWNRMKKKASSHSDGWVFESMKSYKAVDERTIQIVLKKPNPRFLHGLTLPVSYPVREEHLSAKFRSAAMPLAGPYRIESWNKKESVFTLKKNSSYHEKQNGPDVITVHTIYDLKDARPLFEQGKLDILTLVDTDTVTNVRSVGESKATPRFMAFDIWFLDYLFFNLRSPLAGSLEYRRAIALALDPAKIARELSSGQRPATGLILKGMDGYQSEKAVYDLIEARKSLKAWHDKNKHAAKKSFRILYYETPVSRKIERVVSAQLEAALGIQVQSRFVPFKNYHAELKKGAYDAALGYYSPTDGFADGLLQRFQGTSAENHAHYRDPEFDKQVGELLVKPLDEREDLYQKLESKLLRESHVIAPLSEGMLPVLVAPRVKELWISPLNTLWLPDVRVE